MSSRSTFAFVAVLAMLISGCTSPPTGATREANLRGVADIVADLWSVGPSSSRSTIAQQALRPLFEDPYVQDAYTKKPFLTTAEAYWTKLESEGLALLSDDELRKGVSIRLRLLRGATNEECASYVAASASGAWLGPEGKGWRSRLARATDEEFDVALRLQVQAVRTRARRIAEPPFALAQSEHVRALGQLVLALPREAQERISDAAGRGSTLGPSETCRVAVDLLSAQENASGNALRVFLVQPSR